MTKRELIDTVLAGIPDDAVIVTDDGGGIVEPIELSAELIVARKNQWEGETRPCWEKHGNDRPALETMVAVIIG